MSSKRLAGKTVLVTRAKEQATELSELIKSHGGTVIEVPLLTFEPSIDEEQNMRLKQLSSYDWLIFTSVNGVHFFMKRYKMIYQNEAFPPISIAVVGEKTEAALSMYQIKVDLVPHDYTAEGMVDVLADHINEGDLILLARGNLGRSVLTVELSKMGAHVDDLAMYETRRPPLAKTEMAQLLQQHIPIDYVTFTSSSTVTHYVEILNELQRYKTHFKPKLACIGPIAAKTATDLGLTVDIVSPTYTIESLVEQLAIHTRGIKS